VPPVKYGGSEKARNPTTARARAGASHFVVDERDAYVIRK
jgi:hypothetical protein